MPPTKLLAVRRMAAAATGISQHGQSCLTSCVLFAYGRRKDTWHFLLKEIELRKEIPRDAPCFSKIEHPQEIPGEVQFSKKRTI